MAEIKSVTFSPILEHAPDDVSVVSSDTGLVPKEMKFEDAYIASLSKSARKYQLPTEDAPRAPRRRKIALLTLGFILLLGIGAAVIYLVTRELYNREKHYYSGAVSELNKTGLASKGTHIKGATKSVWSFNTIKPSSESSEKQVSLNSSKTTVYLSSETGKTVSKLSTSVTFIESSGLVTRFGAKNHNATTSTLSTPNLASSRKTTSHLASRHDINRMYSTPKPVIHTSQSGDTKTISSYSLLHGTSRSFTERSKENTDSFHPPVSSSGIIKSTSVVQKAVSNAPTPSAEKKEASENISIKSTTVTLQDIETVGNGITSFEAKYIPSTLPTSIRKSSEFAYSKSVDSQLTSRQSNQHSKLVRTSSLAVTTANLESSWKSSENSLHTGKMNMIRGITASTLLPTAKSGVSSSLYSNSFEGSSSGSTFSPDWVSSQSIGSGETRVMVNHTSVRKESSFSKNYGSLVSMHFSPTPTSGSVTSFIKGHKTSQLFNLSSYTANRLVSKEQPSNHSGYSSKSIVTVLKTVFSSLSLSANQGSSKLQDILTSTKATSLSATHQSHPSTLVPRSPKLVISTQPLYTTHNSNGFSTVGAVGDVTSLETTSSLSSHLQTRPSIGTQFSIKAISLSSTVSLNTNSNTESPLLSSSPAEFNSLAIALASSYDPVLSYSSFEELPTAASEMESTDSVSLWIPSQTSVSYSSSTISQQTLTSRKMSTQGKIGVSIVSSYVHVQQSKSKSSIKESPTTTSTISTKKVSKAYHQSLHKDTSDAPTKSTFTRIYITTTQPSRQSPVLSRGVQSVTRFLPTAEMSAKRMTSSFEGSWLSTINSGEQQSTSDNPHGTSQHLPMYTATSDTLGISTVRLSPVTKVSSNTRGMSNALSDSRRRTSSRVENVGLSSDIFSTARPSFSESINVSLSRTRVNSVSSTELHKTFQHTLLTDSSNTTTNSTVVQISIPTLSLSIQSTVLSRNTSSASQIITPASSNISLSAHNTSTSQSFNSSTKGTAMLIPSPTHTSTTHVKPIMTTDLYLFSSVSTTFRPTLNTTTQFKIMDGSLVIRNRNFHANLSNPNSTMFKVLANEVEEIITEIVSLDAKVISFRNGSIIADFYLMVAYDSPFSDQDYAQMLSEASESLWRGYYVTNITVTLRVSTGRPAARLQDGGGLSKAAVVAIFAVFSVLLIVVGSFGVYVCTKKGMCERSRVKPSDSPIPPSELEKIQPVRRGTWVANDEPFLKVDVPKDPNYRSASILRNVKLESFGKK
ncbi:hypothetical protein ACROYT_G037214 [Oculina patagonica]